MKEGWEVKRLGDLCEIITKGTTPTSIGYNFVESGINFIKIESIAPNGEFIKNKFASISNDCHSTLKRSQLKANDILFSIAGALGRTALVNDDILPANTNQALAIIRLKNISGLLPGFILRSLNSWQIFEQINGLKGGVAQQNLSLEQISNFRIPLPPLPEQHRIVAILDEAFAAIAKAKENAEKNLANAQEVFESYLQSVFANRGEGWEEKRLGDACELIMGQSPQGNTYNSYGKGVPLINGPVEFGDEPFSETIKSKFTTAPTKMCKKGDLILCVRGSTTGRINIAGFDACIGRGVAAIRYDKCQHWINYFILSKRKKIYELGTGSTFPNVSTKILEDLIVPSPILNEQQSLISKFDSLSSETQKLETIYKQKIAALEELKKSILEKAFTGELTN